MLENDLFCYYIEQRCSGGTIKIHRMVSVRSGEFTLRILTPQNTTCPHYTWSAGSGLRPSTDCCASFFLRHNRTTGRIPANCIRIPATVNGHLYPSNVSAINPGNRYPFRV